MKDLTWAAYRRKVAAYGFGEPGPFGHRTLPKPHDHIAVSEWNGGETYRSRLAYLLDQLRRAEKRAEG